MEFRPGAEETAPSDEDFCGQDIRRSMLDRCVAVGRIGELALANKGTILAVCQLSVRDLDTDGEFPAARKSICVP